MQEAAGDLEVRLEAGGEADDLLEAEVEADDRLEVSGEAEDPLVEDPVGKTDRLFADRPLPPEKNNMVLGLNKFFRK
jgi:hypothetical protein